MPNTPKTAAAILSDFADNDSGLITPQLLRDFVVSVLNTVDYPVSTFAKTLLDDTSASSARTTLGLGSASTNATGDFAAASHTHAESDITGLVSDLAGKAATVHTHAQADVTGLVSALAGKASSSHTHAESDITGLVADLAGKAAASHTHTISQVTDAGTAAALNVAASGNATSGQVVKGNDTRLSDSRTPAAHASSHGSGQSDEITIDQSQVANLTTDLAAKLALDGGTMAGDIRMSGNHVWMNEGVGGVGGFNDTGGGNLYMESGNIWMGGLLGEGGGFIRMADDSYIVGGEIRGVPIKDSTAENSINPSSRNLYDSGAALSIDWENRILKNDGGTNVISWNNAVVLGDGMNVNGFTINMKDGSGSGGGNLYMDGGTLYGGTDGFIHMMGGNIGHVQDFTMFGKLNMQSGSAITDDTYTSIDPFNRQLANASGTVVLDWDASGRVEVNQLLCNGNMSVDGSLDMYGHGIDSTGDINLNSGKQVIFNGSGGSLTMNKNSINEPVIDPRSSDPSSPAEGQIYYNTSDNHFYGWNGSSWKQLDN